MAFKSIKTVTQGAKFKFENEGDALTGHYLGSDVIEINGDPATKHTFKISDGTLVSPLGSADLDRQLADVPAGMLTRVTYKGKQDRHSKKHNKKFKMRIYDVEVDEEDVIEVESEAPVVEKQLG